MSCLRIDPFHLLRCLLGAVIAAAVLAAASAAGAREPSGVPTAAILDVEAIGLDVHAKLAWVPDAEPPKSALMVVRDAWCGRSYEVPIRPSYGDRGVVGCPGMLSDKCSPRNRFKS